MPSASAPFEPGMWIGDFDPTLITDHAPVLITGVNDSDNRSRTKPGDYHSGSLCDADGDALTYSISGGADKDLFTINASTGVLSFITGPDYENPGDNGGDNLYDLVIGVSDGINSTTQILAVSVSDVGKAWIQRGASIYGEKACEWLGRVRISDDGNTIVAGLGRNINITGETRLTDDGNCDFYNSEGQRDHNQSWGSQSL